MNKINYAKGKELLEKGMDYKEVAKELGCCKESVRKHFRSLIPIKRALAEDIVNKLTEKGMNVHEIAKETGFTTATIYNKLQKLEMSKNTALQDLKDMAIDSMVIKGIQYRLIGKKMKINNTGSFGLKTLKAAKEIFKLKNLKLHTYNSYDQKYIYHIPYGDLTIRVNFIYITRFLKEVHDIMEMYKEEI